MSIHRAIGRACGGGGVTVAVERFPDDAGDSSRFLRSFVVRLISLRRQLRRRLHRRPPEDPLEALGPERSELPWRDGFRTFDHQLDALISIAVELDVDFHLSGWGISALAARDAEIECTRNLFEATPPLTDFAVELESNWLGTEILSRIKSDVTSAQYFKWRLVNEASELVVDHTRLSIRASGEADDHVPVAWPSETLRLPGSAAELANPHKLNYRSFDESRDSAVGYAAELARLVASGLGSASAQECLADLETALGRIDGPVALNAPDEVDHLAAIAAMHDRLLAAETSETAESNRLISEVLAGFLTHQSPWSEPTDPQRESAIVVYRHGSFHRLTLSPLASSSSFVDRWIESAQVANAADDSDSGLDVDDDAAKVPPLTPATLVYVEPDNGCCAYSDFSDGFVDIIYPPGTSDTDVGGPSVALSIGPDGTLGCVHGFMMGGDVVGVRIDHGFLRLQTNRPGELEVATPTSPLNAQDERQ